MASAVDLTTAATAAARLGVAAGDAALPGLITASSEAIAEAMGYPLLRRAGVAETVRGGGMRLKLAAGAVQSITSISCYGAEREVGTYTLEDGIKGIVLAFSQPWPFTGRTGGGVSQAPTFREDTGNITVTVTAGWVTPGQVVLDATKTRDLPHSIEQACIIVVTAWYLERGKNPNVTSQSTGNAAISFDAGHGGRVALPLNALQLLRRYRKHVRP
jgi:hypothetical protein